jgi:hypothetical protein
VKPKYPYAPQVLWLHGAINPPFLLLILPNALALIGFLVGQMNLIRRTKYCVLRLVIFMPKNKVLVTIRD